MIADELQKPITSYECTTVTRPQNLEPLQPFHPCKVRLRETFQPLHVFQTPPLPLPPPVALVKQTITRTRLVGTLMTDIQVFTYVP